MDHACCDGLYVGFDRYDNYVIYQNILHCSKLIKLLVNYLKHVISDERKSYD